MNLSSLQQCILGCFGDSFPAPVLPEKPESDISLRPFFLAIPQGRTCFPVRSFTMPGVNHFCVKEWY